MLIFFLIIPGFWPFLMEKQNLTLNSEILESNRFQLTQSAILKDARSEAFLVRLENKTFKGQFYC